MEIKRGRPMSGEAKKTSINIRVTYEQRAKIKLNAAKEGLSISEYAIKKMLEK